MYVADHARDDARQAGDDLRRDRRGRHLRELNDRSNRLAQFLHARGLRRGDHIAILMENNLRFMEAVWAAFRSGLYLTAVNRYLPPDEAAYIVNDCMAQGDRHLLRQAARRRPGSPT